MNFRILCICGWETPPTGCNYAPARTPDLPAIVSENESLSYVQLNARANRGVQLFREPSVGALADALKIALKSAREASISGYAAISSGRV